MYRIAIYDDEKDSVEKISTILSQYITMSGLIAKQNIYVNGKLLSADIDDGIIYDIYILNIEMPQVSGIEIAKKIRQCKSDVIIIFVTPHLKYTSVSFELGIFRYMAKRHLDEQLPLALKAAFSVLECREGKYYLISNSRNSTKILFKDILYIFKEGKNSIFVTNKSEVKTRETLVEVYGKLSKDDFMQMDRCYIVNLWHVYKVAMPENVVILRNDIKLYIAKNKIKEVKNRLNEFWKEGI